MVFANPATADILGYTPEELQARSPSELTAIIHPDDRDAIITQITRLWRGQIDSVRQEFRIRDRQGATRWVETLASRVEYQGKSALQLAYIDISERKRVEEQLRASLAEKELLLKEIHHRVKNNLQIISSLLEAQAEEIEDSRLRAAFRESQQRVQSIALIHQELYQTGNLASIDFGAFVHHLVAHLVASYAIHPGQVTLDIQADPVILGVDTAIPCGLLINELVSNALKHAFPGNRQGRIQVELHRQGKQVMLIVGDNGVGLPQDLDIATSTTLGLQLVTMLAQQLGGKLEVEGNGGTTFRVAFALPDSNGAVSARAA